MSSGFRFSAILSLRQQERDQAAVELAKIDAAARELDQQQESISIQRTSLRAAHQSLRSGIISAHQLKSRADFDRALRHAESELLKKREALEIQFLQTHDHLIAAQQEVAKLEKLQQLDQSRHQAKTRQQLMREEDAILTARYRK